MSSRTWVNLILLGLTVILALAVTFKPDQESEPAMTVTDLEPTEITQITIQRLAKAEIRLVRQDSGWRLKAPIEIAANQIQVNTLLQLARKESLARYSVKELDLTVYGLKPVLSNIMLNSIDINIGAPNPVTGRRYLKIDDSVHLIDDDLYDIYFTEAASYAATRLLPLRHEIRRLSLPGLELSKTSSNHWEVSSADRGTPSKEPRIVVENWQNASAHWVQTYDGAETLAEVTVTLMDGQVLHFIATAIQPQLVLARPELQLQYHLSADRSVHLLPGWNLDTSQ